MFQVRLICQRPLMQKMARCRDSCSMSESLRHGQCRQRGNRIGRKAAYLEMLVIGGGVEQRALSVYCIK